MKPEFSRKIVMKHANIKFHENPSSGIKAVPCGRINSQTNTIKLIATFPNFANAPKKFVFLSNEL